MKPQLVVIASTNPVKIDATRQGFQRMFPEVDFEFHGTSADSGVSDQPMTRNETQQGAANRARHAARLFPDAEFTVGIEGGVAEVDGHLEVFAWVVILNHDRLGQAQTGIFILPDEVAQLVKAGNELGHADDLVFKRSNSKQKNGSIGLLTDDVLTRLEYYVNAVIMALIPFKKPHLTWT